MIDYSSGLFTMKQSMLFICIGQPYRIVINNKFNKHVYAVLLLSEENLSLLG